MTDKNKHIEDFSRLLEKLNLQHPAGEDVKKHITASKKKQFKKTLKRTGFYSGIFGLISHVFFSLKKFGISITIIKSAALVGIVSLGAVAVITTGTYITVKKLSVQKDLNKSTGENIKINDKPDENKAVDSPTQPGTNTAQRGEEKHTDELSVTIKNRIAVQPLVRPFINGNVQTDVTRLVTDQLADALKKIRGDDLVINVRYGHQGRESGMMLIGTVDSVQCSSVLDCSYLIKVRLVSARDSRIILYTEETAVSKDEIPGACKRLAEKIYKKIE